MLNNIQVTNDLRYIKYNQKKKKKQSLRNIKVNKILKNHFILGALHNLFSSKSTTKEKNLCLVKILRLISFNHQPSLNEFRENDYYPVFLDQTAFFVILTPHKKVCLDYITISFLFSPFLLLNPSAGIWVAIWFLVPADRPAGPGCGAAQGCQSSSFVPKGPYCCWCGNMAVWTSMWSPMAQLRHADSQPQGKWRFLHAVVHRFTSISQTIFTNEG